MLRAPKCSSRGRRERTEEGKVPELLVDIAAAAYGGRKMRDWLEAMQIYGYPFRVLYLSVRLRISGILQYVSESLKLHL